MLHNSKILQNNSATYLEVVEQRRLYSDHMRRLLLARATIDAEAPPTSFGIENRQKKLSKKREMQLQLEADKINFVNNLYQNKINSNNSLSNYNVNLTFADSKAKNPNDSHQTARRRSSSIGRGANTKENLISLPDDEFEKVFLYKKDENEDEEFEKFERDFLNRPSTQIQPRKKKNPNIVTPNVKQSKRKDRNQSSQNQEYQPVEPQINDDQSSPPKAPRKKSEDRKSVV